MVGILLIGCATVTEQKFTYEKIITIDALKDELFVAANLWIADLFFSDATIEYSDKEAGVMACNVIIPVNLFDDT